MVKICVLEYLFVLILVVVFMFVFFIVDYYVFLDVQGYFGCYGGSFVVEILVGLLQELVQVYDQVCQDLVFQVVYDCDLVYYVGWLSLIYYVQCLSDYVGGVQILFKCEDLNYIGVYKINNIIGQVLLVVWMGKMCIIVEIGVGQYGVVSVIVVVCLGLECVVYMGVIDIEWQKINVYCMKLFGVMVVLVIFGLVILKDVFNEVMCDWVINVQDIFYIIGIVVGLDLYLCMVCDFNVIVGCEVCEQMLVEYGCLFDVIIVCVGGGSNVIGLFYVFFNDCQVEIVGVEVVGDGIGIGCYVVLIVVGWLGVLYGNCIYVLCDDDGQIIEIYLVLVGLDYLGVGLEYVFLVDIGCVCYFGIIDEEVLQVFYLLVYIEGILLVLEFSYVLVQVIKLVCECLCDQIVLCNLFGCGDKDVYIIVVCEGFVL